MGILTFINSGQSSIARADLLNDAGTLKWRVAIKDNGVYTYATASTGPSLAAWYTVELYAKIDATAGEATLWVNGIQVATLTNKDTDNNGNIGGWVIGEWFGTDSTTSVSGYGDCVVVG